MSDFPPDERPEELWGAPDFEGSTHVRPLPDWFSGSKSLLPACRHWREPVGLLDEVVVFASADRPQRRHELAGRGLLPGRELVRCGARLLARVPAAIRPATEGPDRRLSVAGPRRAARTSKVPSRFAMAARTGVRRPPRRDRVRWGTRPDRDHACRAARPAGALAAIRDPSGQARLLRGGDRVEGAGGPWARHRPMSPWSRPKEKSEAERNRTRRTRRTTP
jgi:hypothetical protein